MDTKLIGSKIAKARKRVNISQAQLAQRLFISPQAVGKWERGESIPDINTVNRLAVTPAEPLDRPSDGLPSGKHPDSYREKKLSWDMSRGNWVDADFSGLKNLHEKFSSSNMKSCKFIGSDLSGLLLKGNNVDRCDFSGSNISNSQIQRSNLQNNQFKDCSLNEAEFSGSNIDRCDFSGANFTGTEFFKKLYLRL